ncbi:hypothetical protein JOC77_003599 [Peribacillus deserti]|uniref:YheE family protein n=1 Tax=Peribacillus deserti TaxID=673318 RepID=A0ABS2QMB3_9BACI|nr:DUF5342 family protein [Peribacillus deserti]MBM7694155.1 hypothetical protein [Peribacillus deserti]
MISHFTYENLFTHSEMPGWKISFFYKQGPYSGIYHSNGRIEWLSEAPEKDNASNIESYIHELMLYHVYE